MIKTAVVGVGRMGSKHAYNLAKRVKNSELVAICDLSHQKADLMAKKLKVKAYYDVDEMLENEALDAVVIATPHYEHVNIALKCLEKKINVLCEKPLSVTTLEANKLLKAVEGTDLICSMMYNQRTNNMYIKAKALIESGAIGKIQRINYTITDWYRAQFYYNMGGWRASWTGEGGGTLINQCVHQLDLIQWLCGMPTTIKAFCETKNRNISTENDVTAIMRFDGFDGVFTASTHEIPGVNRFEIAGDKGIITIFSKTMKYRINKMSESEVNNRAKRDYGNSRDKGGFTYHSWYGLKKGILDAIRGQQCNILENFIEAIEAKDKSLLIAPIEEGIKALTMINALYMSSLTGKDVKIPFDDEEYAKLLKEQVEKEKQD